MKKGGFVRKSPQFESSPPRVSENFKKKVKEYNCNECDFQGKIETELKRHVSLKHKMKENEYNCNSCDYQGTREIELNKHVNLKHTAKGTLMGNTIKCRNCGDQFSTKWNLMNHRKSEHLSSVAYCRNNIEGKCEYSEDMCWWNHAERLADENENIRCYLCDKMFDSKAHMMKHRKIEHLNLVRPCNQFRQNCCRFKSESCWFKHDLEYETESNGKSASNVDSSEKGNESVFQKVSENLEPPLQNHQKKQMQ